MVDIFYRVFGPKLGDCFDEPTMLGVTWTMVEKRRGGMREDGTMDDGPKTETYSKTGFTLSHRRTNSPTFC